jgi:Tol biopolymer transport system component
LHELTGTGKWTRLVASTATSLSGVWSPDEKYVAVTAGFQGEEFENLYLLNLDSPGQPKRIAPSGSGQFAQAWHPAIGLVYTESEKPPTLIDVLRVDPLTQSKPSPFVTTPTHDSHASVSPDGRWVVYSADWQSQPSIYVRPVNGSDTQAQRVAPGSCSAWSPTGREIFYRYKDGMWSLPVNDGRPAAPPRRLFDLPGVCRIWNREYAVSSDGNRFLVTKHVPDAEEGRHIQVVLNWTTELTRLVPPRP